MTAYDVSVCYRILVGLPVCLHIHDISSTPNAHNKITIPTQRSLSWSFNQIGPKPYNVSYVSTGLCICYGTIYESACKILMWKIFHDYCSEYSRFYKLLSAILLVYFRICVFNLSTNIINIVAPPQYNRWVYSLYHKTAVFQPSEIKLQWDFKYKIVTLKQRTGFSALQPTLSSTFNIFCYVIFLK